MIYTEIEIKDQIKAGGLNDWRINIGGHAVSVQCVAAPAYFGDQKSVYSIVIMRRLAAICRILVPANKYCIIDTDGKTYFRLSSGEGAKLGTLEFDEKHGVIFGGNGWEKKTGAALTKDDRIKQYKPKTPQAGKTRITLYGTGKSPMRPKGSVFSKKKEDAEELIRQGYAATNQWDAFRYPETRKRPK